ncbi:hypothetical protein MBH78_11660 [Oceanimonas sp. NS1]|nr:hypothetical protein [Oceanimonas sp. NS1]
MQPEAINECRPALVSISLPFRPAEGWASCWLPWGSSPPAPTGTAGAGSGLVAAAGLATGAPAPSGPVTGSLTVPLSDADKRVIDVPTGGKRIDHTLASGETLSSLFRDWQLPGQELIALVRAEPSYKPLSRLQAGQQLTLVLAADGRLQYLEIRDNGLVLNAFRRLGQEFSAVSVP